MRIVWAAALAMVVMLSTPADACSCSVNPFPFTDGAVVPANARLPLLDLMPGTVDLTLARLTLDGEDVPITLTPGPAGAFVLAPQQPLVAGATYSLTDGTRSAELRASDGEDTTAPAAPKLTSTRHIVSPLVGRSTCDLGGEVFQIDFESNDDAVVLEVFTGPTVSSIDLSNPVLVLPSRFKQFGLGDASRCGPRVATSRMPDLAVQVRAVDLAGNRSELSNALQLKTGGCSATGGTALILLSALFLRRRRP